MNIQDLTTTITESGNSCTISETQISNREMILETISKKIVRVIDEQDKIVLSFEYDTSIAHLLLDFVIQEQECCNFLTFTLVFQKESEEIRLEIVSNSLDHPTLKKMISDIIKT